MPRNAEKDGDTAEPREEETIETIECIQVCVNIREWQDISGTLFLVLWFVILGVNGGEKADGWMQNQIHYELHSRIIRKVWSHKDKSKILAVLICCTNTTRLSILMQIYFLW